MISINGWAWAKVKEGTVCIIEEGEVKSRVGEWFYFLEVYMVLRWL